MKKGERSILIKNMLMGNKAVLIVLGLSVILSLASPVFLKMCIRDRD